MQGSPDGTVLGLGAVFTLMVVTLGPIKILGPFAQATSEDDPATTRVIAFKAFLFSIAAVLISALAGLGLLNKWHISVPGLELSGGIIFLIIGLRIVLEQYQPPAPAVHPTPPANTTAAALRLTFPTIITPYGIAAVMVLLARSPDVRRTSMIVLVVVLVMVLNLLAMLGSRKVMGGVTLMILRIVGSVLGVLQVALAVEMILRSLTDLGVLHA